MKNPPACRRGHLVAVRVVCSLCAAYFAAMGLVLMLFPTFITRVADPPDPVILGILRGAGGSILPYAMLYTLVARSPFAQLGVVAVIAVANAVAIVLDILSVHLGEYRWSYAMLDIPVEAVSLLFMLLILNMNRNRGET